MALCGVAFLPSSSLACDVGVMHRLGSSDLLTMQGMQKSQEVSSSYNMSYKNNEFEEYSEVQYKSPEDSVLPQDFGYVSDSDSEDENSLVSNQSSNQVSNQGLPRVISLGNNFVPKAMLAMFIVSSMIEDSYGMQGSQIGGGAAVSLGWNVIMGVTFLWLWIFTIVTAAKLW